MVHYRECPFCGGSLDPGEKCDCQGKSSKDAKSQAKRKLARIIEREGDSNGERRKPYYLEQLIAEAASSECFSKFTL